MKVDPYVLLQQYWFQVPNSTLHERFKRYQKEGESMSMKAKLGRFENTFTPEMEQKLADYTLELDRWNMGLSKREFLRLAFDLATKRGETSYLPSSLT